MTYDELKQEFRTHEAQHPKEHLTGYITFTEDSFTKPFSLLSRTYRVSSFNKAFRPNMCGYSIFGTCLDDPSSAVRLDARMAEERGGADGWTVEDCLILERMRDAAAIAHLERTPQDGGEVCYFFADTTIRVRETVQDGKLRLTPVRGDQIAHGEWYDLDEPELTGYCELLERAINSLNQNRRAKTL